MCRIWYNYCQKGSDKTMTDDFSILQSIIENSGREGYITDEKFNVLWTNSDKSLIGVLLESNHGTLVQPKEKETAISCSDGSVLKITPLIKNGRPQGYLFERYISNQIVDMLSKTSVFKSFSRQYSDFRESTMELLMHLQAENAENIHKEDIDETNRLIAGSVNKTGLFKILSPEDEPLTVDLYVPISYCCGSMQIVANRSQVDIVSDIAPGLFASTHHTSFEYVFINLLLNAYAHGDPEGKRILVKGYRDMDDVVIEIHDNGKNADLERINSFRTLYAADRPHTEGEGLGIAIAQIFADRYGGTLSFSISELGGLCARLRLPYKIPDSRISLFSPAYNDDEDKLMIDLMRKCFSAEELKSLAKKQKMLPH